MTAAITARGITKSFGTMSALKDVDLEVPAGSVLGLLGPNGAGKTTMVRILATLEQPDDGSAWVNGFDVVRQPALVRRSIGLTGQYAALDEDISGRENLYMVARLLNLSPKRARARADEMLERFGLTDAAGRIARRYSGGMRRRLDLALSLVGNPQVLYLDEPTTGLDPHSRNALWEIVRSMTKQGVTVLLTTQYMEEAEALADRVTVLHHSRVIASGTPADLRARIGGNVLHVRLVDGVRLPELLRRLAESGLEATGPPVGTAVGVANAPGEGAGPEGVDEAGLIRVPVPGEAQLARALRALADAGVPILAIETRVPSLDEVFLTLTGSAAVRPSDGEPEHVTDALAGSSR